MFPAGAETTRSAIGLGLKTLIEQPDSLRRLRAEPALIRSAAEEIVRWTSPVNYMRRTASLDCEVAGQKILEGEGADVDTLLGHRNRAQPERSTNTTDSVEAATQILALPCDRTSRE